MLSVYQYLSQNKRYFEKLTADSFRIDLFENAKYYEYFKNKTIAEYNKICKDTAKNLIESLLKKSQDNDKMMFIMCYKEDYDFIVPCCYRVYASDLEKCFKNNDFKNIKTYGTEIMQNTDIANLFIPTAQEKYANQIMRSILNDAWYSHKSIFLDLSRNRIEVNVSEESINAQIGISETTFGIIETLKEEKFNKYRTMSDEEHFKVIKKDLLEEENLFKSIATEDLKLS